jgi:hypothetical protein
MDVYVLHWSPHLGGMIISIHARRQGADLAMADYTAAQQADLWITNHNVLDNDDDA